MDRAVTAGLGDGKSCLSKELRDQSRRASWKKGMWGQFGKMGGVWSWTRKQKGGDKTWVLWLVT